MAWNKVEWKCGHTGRIQLYGSMRERDYKLMNEERRKCLACWLLEKWEEEKDDRAGDRDLAIAIAYRKRIEINDEVKNWT